LHLADDPATRVRHAEALGQQRDRAGHLVERAGVERDDLGANRARCREVAARDGAHGAKVLGDQDVRPQLVDQLGVDGVERPPVGDRLAHDPVDLGAGQRRVDARGGHARLVTDLVRPAALLGYRDERVGEPEVGDDLGRAREQRADTRHAARMAPLT
jgi:hypothetical protein